MTEPDEFSKSVGGDVVTVRVDEVERVPLMLYDYTGYSFHLMERGVDAGPVLSDGRIPIDARASAMELEHRKTTAARKDLPAAVERMISGESGRRQDGGGRYFSRAAHRRIRRLAASDALSFEELNRRLDAFGVVTVSIGGQDYPVTAVKRAIGDSEARHQLMIPDADDGTMVVTRCLYMPSLVFAILRRLERLVPGSGGAAR